MSERTNVPDILVFSFPYFFFFFLRSALHFPFSPPPISLQNHVQAAYSRAACYNAQGQLVKAIEDYNLALMKDNAAYGRKGDKRGIKSIPGAMKSPLKQRVGSMAVGVEVFVNGLEQIHRSGGGGGGGGGGLVIPRSDASTNSSDTEKSPASPLTAATTPQRRPPPPPFLSEGAAKVAGGGASTALKFNLQPHQLHIDRGR